MRLFNSELSVDQNSPALCIKLRNKLSVVILVILNQLWKKPVFTYIYWLQRNECTLSFGNERYHGTIKNKLHPVLQTYTKHKVLLASYWIDKGNLFYQMMSMNSVTLPLKDWCQLRWVQDVLHVLQHVFFFVFICFYWTLCYMELFRMNCFIT